MVEEELAALESIYCRPGEFCIHSIGHNADEHTCFTIGLDVQSLSPITEESITTSLSVNQSRRLSITFTLDSSYPATIPLFSINNSLEWSWRDIERCLMEHATALSGSPMLLELIQWLQDQIQVRLESERITYNNSQISDGNGRRGKSGSSNSVISLGHQEGVLNDTDIEVSHKSDKENQLRNNSTVDDAVTALSHNTALRLVGSNFNCATFASNYLQESSPNDITESLPVSDRDASHVDVTNSTRECHLPITSSGDRSVSHKESSYTKGRNISHKSYPGNQTTVSQVKSHICVIHIDHMRRKAIYVKTLKQWCEEIGVCGWVVFLNRLILLVLFGQLDSIKDYIKRLKTTNIDVDSRGRPCKERMANILYHPQPLCDPLNHGFESFEILELDSSKELQEMFTKHNLTSIYTTVIGQLIK